MRDVPVEIAESVIDQLQGDLPTLKACSLVCRLWLPRSQYWLFQEVTICLRSRDQLTDFQQSFTALGLIRKLSVSRDLSELQDFSLRAPFWSKCEGITTLKLCRYSADNLSTRIISFLSNFPNLRSLWLEDCELFFLCTLFHAIRPLPLLTELNTIELMWTSIGEHDHYPSTSTVKAPLRHLLVNQVYDTEDFVELFLKMEPGLCLWSIWTDDVDADLLVMNQCAPTLQTVDLRDQDVSAFDLSPYTSLGTLILSKWQANRISPHIFESISSKNLQHLVLFGHFNDLGFLTSLGSSCYDWELIEAGMALFRYAPQILVCVDRFPPKAKLPPGQLLRDVLPECSRRGMVRVFSRSAPIWKELRVNLEY